MKGCGKVSKKGKSKKAKGDKQLAMGNKQESLVCVSLARVRERARVRAKAA